MLSLREPKSDKAQAPTRNNPKISAMLPGDGVNTQGDALSSKVVEVLIKVARTCLGVVL